MCPPSVDEFNFPGRFQRAFEENHIRRLGTGSRNDPYRYQVANEGDVSMGGGELPALRLDIREAIG